MSSVFHTLLLIYGRVNKHKTKTLIKFLTLNCRVPTLTFRCVFQKAVSKMCASYRPTLLVFSPYTVLTVKEVG